MSKDFSIYKFFQFESIEGKLRKTDVAFERKVRRWYAQELGTSVKATFKESWTEIIAHYYDNQIEETPFNVVFNMAIDEYVPEMAAEAEAEDQAFADSLIAEQEATLAKKAAKLKSELSKDFIPTSSVKKTETVVQNKDKNGGMELSFDMGDPDND